MDSFSIDYITGAIIEAIDDWMLFLAGRVDENDAAVQMCHWLFINEMKLPQAPTRPPSETERKAILQIVAKSIDPAVSFGEAQFDLFVAQASGYFQDACFAEIDVNKRAPAPEGLGTVAKLHPQNLPNVGPGIYEGLSGSLVRPPEYGPAPPELPASVSDYWNPGPPQHYDELVSASEGQPPGEPPGGPGEPPDPTTEPVPDPTTEPLPDS